jgi:hypothetical protein
VTGTVHREDVLALLEDGPKYSLQLAEWIGASEIVVLNELFALRRTGDVKRVHGDRWALSTNQEPALEFGPTAAGVEYEVVWHPHRDAPSLTGGSPGLGTTLSSDGFSLRR